MAVLFDEALSQGTGKGVKIGVLDTGIVAIPSLEGGVTAHYQVVDRDRKIDVIKNEVGFDDIGHGTPCADIIHRHAPDAQLYDLKVMDYKSENSRYKIGAGIRFATQQGWDLLNLCVGTQIDYVRLREVTQDALDKGIMILSAIDCFGESVGYPAGYDEVISVDYDLFPNPMQYRFTEKADVCAHGIYVEAYNVNGVMEAYTGSSFACPHVTALAARVREFFPAMTNREFLTRLRELDGVDQLVNR